MLVSPSPHLWPCLLLETEPQAPRSLCLPASHSEAPSLPPTPQKFLPTILQIPGCGKSWSSFQEILFLESPLTFGLGPAPRLYCFVLGCFYCYSLKNLEPGCPGALAPPWAGPVSLWAGEWPGGWGGGGEGLPRQKGSSLPWTEEVGGGVPGSKTGGLEAGVCLSQDSPGALGVFLQHRTRCNFSEDTGKDPSVQPDSW